MAVDQKLTVLLIAVSMFVVIHADQPNEFDEYINGKLIQSTYLTTKQNVIVPENDETCEKSGIYCSSDCQTLLACSTSNTLITINKCSDLSSSTPYCIPQQAGCSSVGDASIIECGIPVDFQCTNTGYFPDPKNCSIYYVCTDSFVSVYTCPPRYVYDSKTSQCKLRRSLLDCPSINCNNNINKYVAYPGNKTFFGYCANNPNGAPQVIMFRCNDPENFIFNPSSVNCDYVCKREGWFEDKTDCNAFYECYRSGTRLVYLKKTCPEDYIFDKVVGICVAGSCV